MTESPLATEPPLFRDPVYDGATDPTVIRHHATSEWWMLYTQRRASVDGPGVAWIHGSRIGLARADGAGRFHYAGTAQGLDDPRDGPGPHTYWAPEVVRIGEEYRMYLTVIRGVPDRWEGHPRIIREYRSDDLVRWRVVGDLTLSSDRVIDAAVARCPDGRWRLWYKDEADGSTTWAAVSDDAERWRVEGRVIGGRPHEGPNVFALGGWWWMLVDEWRGMAVHRSTDAVRRSRQGGTRSVILGDRGVRVDDATVGRHGDVVVDGERGLLFYFTHPEWNGTEVEQLRDPARRRSSVQGAVLRVVGDELLCFRNEPVRLSNENGKANSS